jgi:excisionase family DNA binding protein
MYGQQTTHQAIGTGQAAQMLGVSQRTVYRWIASGRLPARRVLREWIISLDALRFAVGIRDAK